MDVKGIAKSVAGTECERETRKEIKVGEASLRRAVGRAEDSDSKRGRK